MSSLPLLSLEARRALLDEIWCLLLRPVPDERLAPDGQSHPDDESVPDCPSSREEVIE